MNYNSYQFNQSSMTSSSLIFSIPCNAMVFLRISVTLKLMLGLLLGLPADVSMLRFVFAVLLWFMTELLFASFINCNDNSIRIKFHHIIRLTKKISKVPSSAVNGFIFFLPLNFQIHIQEDWSRLNQIWQLARVKHLLYLKVLCSDG